MDKLKGFVLFLNVLILLLFSSCGINKSLNDLPDVSTYNAAIPSRVRVNDSTYYAGNSFLTKNEHGLWELYVEGDPLERGLLMGSLTRELIEIQERVFITKVNDLVPSTTWQSFLRSFLKWYNRKMYKHVQPEFKAEIFGVSRFALDEFNTIAPPYLRSLYLHSAHDIGHALQDLALVGCSSFAAWGDKTDDGELLIARNFDFYAGDEFAEQKIIAFINPDQGNPYMSITWGGFTGVTSGMNLAGLTVTINASKSKVPLIAKTPISIVSREILQYATTIEEAIAIAKKREVFVSESIMVGSAADGKAILIEVAPSNFGVYDVVNNNQLVCSNHFQSEAFKEDKRNAKSILESHSKYRFDRMEEILQKDEGKMTVVDAVSLLRNREGLNDEKIGFGNEKALNQLLAHHGIVFKPEKRQVWISSNPYQLGEFVSYDLNKVFANRDKNPAMTTLADIEKVIAEDPFVHSEAYKNYEEYRVLERTMESAISEETNVSETMLIELQTKNPDYWKAHYLKGRYLYQQKRYEEALNAFTISATKEITTVPDKERLEKYIEKTQNKMK
ncbi:C45 family autoproteolytic acyltransferase/hydolase [Patiriisocius marinus]|uniref:Acyl-CoA--6-aminopenicillanic acid acyl-transferase n=1 Tax=Patiriisocius marinus TaxID=1397112 RepID=A0A5J4IXU8_9FLAO|nr:C45 family autoproteolytic acyltransferase/hydolase [Patiriisocius marinus]GER58313.1 acyl-CoA--6-aminopenicillanic acid acyl-transferase [Patiriisocius marinus]